MTPTLLLGLLALGTISAKHLHASDAPDASEAAEASEASEDLKALRDAIHEEVDAQAHHEHHEHHEPSNDTYHAHGNTQRAGRRGHVKFIVGGAEVADGECPWQVSVLGDQRKFCGGSIITDRWVLTAAHCVIGVRSFNMVFGSLEMYGGDVDGTVRRVSPFAVPHNRYDRRNNDNDIALIKIQNPLKLSDTVAAIRLPSYSQQKETFLGEPAIVCGWGKTSDFGPTSVHRLLSCVAMPVISLAVCDRHFSGVTSKHVCLDARDARGSCEGDSGGPLIWQDLDGAFTQIGLVSYGSKFCEDGAPGVYTRVSAYLGWIGWNTGMRIAP